MLVKGDNRAHAGNLGYEDSPSSVYKWDDAIPNYDGPAAGDGIVIWDGAKLLGASVIDKIKNSKGEKIRHRCPKCKTTDIKKRRKKTPLYRCDNERCGHVFNSPDEEPVSVRVYQTTHGTGWIDLEEQLTGQELRDLCERKKSQHSIRRLSWEKFLNSIGDSEKRSLERSSEFTESRLTGGHTIARTRVRLGQADFRRNLLKKFGENCALTGPAPRQAIDAAHLYSYAKEQQHVVGGGMLLRKDLHRLFDLGLIAINPATLKIDLAPEIRRIAQYRHLHGAKLAISLPAQGRKWIKEHWQEHRGPFR